MEINSMLENKIGIEAEVLLVDRKSQIVMPPSHMAHDDFPLLGEIRADPGKNPEESYSNFVMKYLQYLKEAEKAGLGILTVQRGGYIVSEDLYHQALVTQGTKGVPVFYNVKYRKVPIINNRVMEDGKFMGIWVSAGLHVHFSSHHVYTNKVASHMVDSNGHCTLIYNDQKYVKDMLSYNDMVTIINGMDKFYAKRYKSTTFPCQYRLEGMYEKKPYGFEYRSLPFVGYIEPVYQICNYAWEQLDKVTREI
jgi:hypothetical protein